MLIEKRANQYGVVFDHWQLCEFLGSGSGGKTAVYRLTHRENPKMQSALKIISLIEREGTIESLNTAQRQQYDAALEQYTRHAENEVDLMYALGGHSNIVGYLDHTVADWAVDGRFGRDLLIRMDYMTCLRSEMRSREERNSFYSEAEIRKIGTDICNALILCHENNILHRDIKPDNIFLGNNHLYKLGDFGVSKIVAQNVENITATSVGAIGYAPAEQAMGVYDRRVDIYALGLTLYELANHYCLPFNSSPYPSMESVERRLRGEPLPPLTTVSSSLDRVIRKACAPRPENRYSTAEEFLASLKAFQVEKTVTQLKLVDVHEKISVFPLTPGQKIQVPDRATPLCYGWELTGCGDDGSITFREREAATDDTISFRPWKIIFGDAPAQTVKRRADIWVPEIPNWAGSWAVEIQGNVVSLKAQKKAVSSSAPSSPSAFPWAWVKWPAGILAAAVLLVSGYALLPLGLEKPEPVAAVQSGITETSVATTATEAPAVTMPPKVESLSAPVKTYTMLKPNDLSDVELEERGEQGFWRQLNVKRQDVESITFLDSTSSAPKHILDFSADADMSVIGWIVGSDVFVAADGKIALNETSSYLFAGMKNLTQINFGGVVDTSHVKDMGHMFQGCEKLEEIDLSGFDTSNVLDMNAMFYGCKRLDDLDVSVFDTSEVRSMKNMFTSCHALTRLDLSNFRTPALTDMKAMFDSCRNLEYVDMTNFDTSNVTGMSNLFSGCASLKEADLSGFDTAKVQNMNAMFYGCGDLTVLDLSGFTSKSLLSTTKMFTGIGQLESFLCEDAAILKAYRAS